MEYEGDEGFVPLWKGSNLDRREFVRLAMQAFEDMGYTGTAQALQTESGFSLEPPAVGQFRRAVLEGRWIDVEQLLESLPIDPSVNLKPVKFAIRQQKFLEAVEAKETKKALTVLRNELSPLDGDPNRLHFLSSLIMCMDPADLRSRANWDGAAGSSREQLLIQLQDYISPTVMLPQRRLATLLGQAQAYQQRHHAIPPSASEPFSLLTDADVQDTGAFPTATSHVLQDHSDEVWRLEWSHNGEWLATAGKDRTVMLWKVNVSSCYLLKIFREHADPVSCIAWSPDDSILLTAAEAIIKMWNTETGVCIATLARHDYAIGALAWLPDGRGFVSGGMDSKICFWDLAGNVTSYLTRCPSRIVDLVITPDGSKLICVGRADTTEPHMIPSRTSSRSITPANAGAQANGNGHPTIGARHEKRVSRSELVQPRELTSVAVTSDSRYAIVSHAPKEILLIDLEDGTVVRKFTGHDQGEFVIRTSFGGASENFILTGSGDGKIYVYHRDTGRLVQSISGHSRTVNAVAWNRAASTSPTNSRGATAMWASCSDDRTVRIWQIPDASSGSGSATSSTTVGTDGAALGRRGGSRLRPLDRSSAPLSES
ncbi:WD40 repeat-like protein [Rhodotorula sp. JG-1b]|nr:WD40 repeat-like protein [Rhodotorula sp. JG-1b]